MAQYSIEELSQIPDLANYPLPLALYKELNLPVPSIPTFKEFLVSYQTAMFHPSSEPGETRPPAEGGNREMPATEAPKDETSDAHPQ